MTGLTIVLRAVAHVVDEQLLLHADLRRGQAEARRVVHDLEHLVGQAHQLAVDVDDLGRRGLQHGVAKTRISRARRSRYRPHAGGPWVSSTSPPGPRPDGPGTAGAAPRPRPAGHRSRCSPATASTRGRTRCCAGRAVRARQARCSTSAAARAHRRRAGPAQPGRRRVWAVDVNERARDLCARNAPRSGATNVRIAAPDDVPADVLGHLEQPAHPHRQGRPPRPAAARWTASSPAGPRTSWSTSTWAPTRWPAGWASRGSTSCAAPPTRATACSTSTASEGRTRSRRVDHPDTAAGKAARAAGWWRRWR